MKPVTMEDLVGTKVLIHLHPEALDILDVQGIDDARFVARVLGFDNFGLWVENPRFCITPIYSDDGNYIEPEARGEICYRAVVLLQWPYIQTILQFPDRPTFGTGLNAAEIGFKLQAIGPVTATPVTASKSSRVAKAKPVTVVKGSAPASAKSAKTKGAKRG